MLFVSEVLHVEEAIVTLDSVKLTTRPSVRTVRQCLAAGAAVLGLLVVSDGAALSLFQVGNSFTFDTKPEGTQAMLEAALGEPVTLAYHIRGNTTLDFMWHNPTASDTFFTPGFGDHTEALPNNHWDFLTLQTFPFSENATLGVELARIQDFVAAADIGSGGQTQVIVYGPWAGRSDGAWGSWDDSVADDPDQPAVYSAAYHDLLYDKVAALYPGRTQLASAGKVIREMRQRIDAGDAPIPSTSRLYRDFIHMSGDIGRFVASTVIQTSILGHSQVGQPVPRDVSPWTAANLPDDVAEWVQLTTWEVMLADPRSQVSQPAPGDYDGNGRVDTADLFLFESTLGSTERLLADGDGDGVVDIGDFYVWREAVPDEPVDGVGDYDGNGRVDANDMRLLIDTFGSTAALEADGSSNGVVDAADYTLWRDRLPRTGDYNGNGMVDYSDYDVFRGTFGSTEWLMADGNVDGVVDAADYTVWRDTVLAGLAESATLAVPEPSSALLVVTLLMYRRRSFRG